MSDDPIVLAVDNARVIYTGEDDPDPFCVPPVAPLPEAVPGEPAKPPVRVKTLAEFFGEYTPYTYVVEPFVRSSSLYTLTAKTGAGKTSFLLILALAIATGRGELIGATVGQGRVAYCTFENPDDFRARLMVAAWFFSIDAAELADNFLIIDRRAKPEEIANALHGNFAFIVCDTLQAGFDGDDLNNNVQGGDFMRRERLLTQLPGNPAVIVAAHPKKGASDDELIPYGAGAILNEVDGNLTLRKLSHGPVELHWQGKLRGLEFDPATFRLDLLTSPEVRDDKGREVPLPVMRPTIEGDAAGREKADIDQKVKMLRAMLESPGASIRELERTTGINKSSIERALNKLATPKEGKLVAKQLDRWSLTKAGHNAVKEAK